MQTTTDRDTTGSLRLFYALWPDDATRAALAQLQTTIRGRKTRYQNLHMTLAFLGEQPSKLLPALKEILADLPHAEIPLVLDRIGYFTKKRIAWAGMHQVPDALIRLAQLLAAELAQQGISCSSVFQPHVTLARDAQAPAEISFAPIRWAANRIVLVQSTTDAEGVCYRVLGPSNINSP